MVFRIHVDRTGGAVTLHLSGRLDDDSLEELQKAYETCSGTVELDLSQLRSVDDVGAAYLRGLIDAGIEVGDANPYMSALLRLDGSGGRGAGRSASSP